MGTMPYLLLRLAIAASFLGHGLVRIPKLKTFSHFMAGTFEKSMLPQSLVVAFAYALPVAELILGILLVTGLQTKPALIIGCLEMIALLFGACLIENWEILPSQLIHVSILIVLLQFIENNVYALDTLFKSTPVI
jgi:thiosulfate dehydrogenase (quinone) large subunit